MGIENERSGVSLARLGIRVLAPSVEELRALTHGGRWLAGAGIGQEFGFRCRCPVGAGTALSRLIRHFGLPNGPHFHCWNTEFLRQRDKSTWEFIFLVNKRFFFAVYDYKEQVSVGYRLIAPRGACAASRADFTADAETCERFCRYVEAVVNFPPESVDASWRGYP